MNIFKFIGRFFRRPFKEQPVELTQEQVTDMIYYANHEWPAPAEALVPGDTVWFLGKGKTVSWGTVASCRCTNLGYAYYVVNLQGNKAKTRGFREGEPLFRHREDALLWHIGRMWLLISRMYKNLETAVANTAYLTAYTERRVKDYKATISFLENQLVLRSPDELNWEVANG